MKAIAFLVQDPRMFATLGRFPFSTLPLYIVPAILLTHALAFLRLLGSRTR